MLVARKRHRGSTYSHPGSKVPICKICKYLFPTGIMDAVQVVGSYAPQQQAVRPKKSPPLGILMIQPAQDCWAPKDRRHRLGRGLVRIKKQKMLWYTLCLDEGVPNLRYFT